jgi:hypothetical protein
MAHLLIRVVVLVLVLVLPVGCRATLIANA